MNVLLKVSLVLQLCLANFAGATTIIHVGTLIDGVNDRAGHMVCAHDCRGQVGR